MVGVNCALFIDVASFGLSRGIDVLRKNRGRGLWVGGYL